MEFATVLPVMLLLLLLPIDFGRLFFSYVQINNAAREGAAYGAANPGDLTGITTRAVQETDAQAQRGEGAVAITAACTDSTGVTIACSSAPGGGGAGNRIVVTAIEPFTFLTPMINGFFGGGLTMRASATSTVLGFAASAGGTAPPSCPPPDVPVLASVSVSGMIATLDASAATPNSGLCAISGYNWDMGDSDNAYGKQTSYDYTTAGAGTYTITLQVTNQGGSATATFSVTVPTAGPTSIPTISPSPSASASTSPSPTCNYQPSFTYQQGKNGGSNNFNSDVTFQGSYTGQPKPATWTWDYGDSNSGSGQNPIHTYPKVGKSAANYNVTLTINQSGCPSASTTQTVTLQP